MSAIDLPGKSPRPSARRGVKSVRFGALPSLAIACFVSAPIVFVLASLFAGETGIHGHIWTTTGPRYLAGTLLLCAIVGVSASVIGVVAAILVAATEFPGRRIVSTALVLPFAVPAYISAYAYADLLGPFGAAAGVIGPGTVSIRNLPGAAFILTLSVYPYIYLAMRASLESRSGSFLEAARMLGARPADALRKTLLPAGGAAFAGGLALALMETAADFGVADYYGVQTLSVGIFRTWHGLGNLAAASQIAAGLFLVALLLILLDEASRRGIGAEGPRALRRSARLELNGLHGAAALIFCCMPVALGFLTPLGVLIAKTAAPAAPAIQKLAEAAANTGLVAALGAALAVVLASMLAFRSRRTRSALEKLAVRIATLGYALPGAVLAIGILAAAESVRPGLGVSAGFGMLLYAYSTRFLTAGFNAVSGGVAQIHPLTDDAARMLGAGPSSVLVKIHWPLASRAIAAGALVVFIDIAKELPATLLLRPFNFETLATQIYRFASDERLADAAPAALALILISLAPALIIDAFGRSGSAPLRR